MADLATPVRFYSDAEHGPIEYHDGLVAADAHLAEVDDRLVTLSIGTGDPSRAYGFEADLTPAEAHRLGSALIREALRGLDANELAAIAAAAATTFRPRP